MPRCSRENCPSDAVKMETHVSREMRMMMAMYKCQLCGAIYAEEYGPGMVLLSVRYLEPRRPE